MVLSFLEGAVAGFVVIGRLTAGRGATTDPVRDVWIVFAEPLWDRTATCCRSRLYCLVKSAERKRKKVKDRKGAKKRKTSLAQRSPNPRLRPVDHRTRRIGRHSQDQTTVLLLRRWPSLPGRCMRDRLVLDHVLRGLVVWWGMALVVTIKGKVVGTRLGRDGRRPAPPNIDTGGRVRFCVASYG